ncbi:hypothetical protein [Streptococcus sp. S784/96/1]|uniref:hypothetical protein n=1 Tax=Streptococcus sp. S784/96/1 TaxID=2653499 RepID=UPI001386B9AE|nr:hypothetical protein [Streptococcus sp. S784/96/1]
MYHNHLLKRLKIGLGFILVLVSMAFGYGFAHIKYQLAQKKEAKSEQVTTNASHQENQLLKEQEIKDFLIAYYTKAELEENRSRYKPFMTDNLYQTIVLDEDKPVSQAYKGYIVDQVFTSSTIYIDQTNQSAIVQATYDSVLLQEKGNRQSLQTKRQTTDTLRLKYMKQEGRYLLSGMEPILLSDTQEALFTTYQDTPTSSSSATSEAPATESQGEQSDEQNR